MSGERGRGAVLHGSAALLLVAGVFWWWRAAPREEADERLTAWRLAAEQLLPETGELEVANTVALAAEAEYETVDELDAGTVLVSVVCAGPDDSRARVSLGDDDSGRGLRCSGTRTPEVFSVGVGNQLRLRVTVERAGPVVFRYTLQRNPQD